MAVALDIPVSDVLIVATCVTSPVPVDSIVLIRVFSPVVSCDVVTLPDRTPSKYAGSADVVPRTPDIALYAPATPAAEINLTQ